MRFKKYLGVYKRKSTNKFRSGKGPETSESVKILKILINNKMKNSFIAESFGPILDWEMRFSTWLALILLLPEVLNETQQVQKNIRTFILKVTIGQTLTSKITKTSFSRFIKGRRLCR
jgi:hypothetical protein